jgi:hypothetical protein
MMGGACAAEGRMSHGSPPLQPQPCCRLSPLPMQYLQQAAQPHGRPLAGSVEESVKAAWRAG